MNDVISPSRLRLSPLLIKESLIYVQSGKINAFLYRRQAVETDTEGSRKHPAIPAMQK